MIYENEITVVFNLVNKRTGRILGGSRAPHILRIPSGMIPEGGLDAFLETYRPLLDFIKTECRTRDDWKNGVIEYYNIQGDFAENVVVEDVIPPPVSSEEYAREVILETVRQCLSKFNILDSFIKEDAGFDETFERLCDELKKKKISQQSINLYVLSQTEDLVEPDVYDEIKKICELK